MRFLVFSLIFIAFMYAVPTGMVLWKKQSAIIEMEMISKDLGNVCKGIAATIIMLSHIGNGFGTRILTPLGSWGVGIFLLLSGYGLEKSFQNNGLVGFWKKRIKTAYIPYLMVELVAILLKLGPAYTDIMFWDVVKDFLLIDPLHPFGWYMQCLFIYYIFFYLASFCCKKKARKNAMLCILAFVMFLLFRGLFKQQLLTFVIGVLLAQQNDVQKLQKRCEIRSFGILAIGIVCLMLRQIPVIRNLPWAAYNFIHAAQVAALSTGTIWGVSWLGQSLAPWFWHIPRRVGMLAFELYLLHGFVLSAVGNWEMSYSVIIFFFLASFGIAITVNLANKIVRNAFLKKR